MSFWKYIGFDEEADVMPTIPIQQAGVVQAIDVPNGTVTLTTGVTNRLDDLNRAINAQGQLIAQQQQAMGQVQINIGTAGGGGGTGEGGLLFGQQQNQWHTQIYNPPTDYTWWGQAGGFWQGTNEQAQQLPREEAQVEIRNPWLEAGLLMPRFRIRADGTMVREEPEQPRRPRRKLNLPDWF